MGTTLTGTQIQNTYDGLIKTTDNTAISATTKLISDGLGNDTCIKVGTAGTDFLGNVDFSAATVTGLPGGAAGLVNGTGADSLKNADSLVTTPADSNFACDIALGNGALTNVGATVPQSYGAIAIGNNTTACIDSITIGGNSTNTTSYGSLLFGFNNSNSFANGSIAIGANNSVSAFRALAIGNTITSSGQCSIAIGSLASIGAAANNSIAIGSSATTIQQDSITIGYAACAQGNRDVIIGCGAASSVSNKGGTAVGSETDVQDGAIAIGRNAQATGIHAIAIGGQCNLFSTNCTLASSTAAIAIGTGASATAASAVAIGQNVAATTVDTVSVKALETQTASTPTAGGIIMTDAGSVARRLNIDASGNLQIDSTPVGGGGGAAGLVSGTATDSMKNADSLVTNPATVGATAYCSITLGDNATSSNIRNISIGQNAFVSANNGLAIGGCSTSTGYSGVAIGFRASGTSFWGGVAAGALACVSGNYGVAIGPGAIASAT